MSIPAATSLVVLGQNWSERTVTEQLGQVSVMRSAVDRPMSPAPTTATLGEAISRMQSQSREVPTCVWKQCITCHYDPGRVSGYEIPTGDVT